MPEGALPHALMAQAARAYADRVALRFGERSWTFAEFDAAVNRLAAGLAQRFDKGARIALFMANCAEYLLLQCAIERAGLVRVPVNSRATAYELGEIAADCEPAALFYDRASAERAGTVSIWSLAIEELPTLQAEGTAGERARLDDLCSINYTSGTSGRPKGAMLSHRNWAALYRNMLIDRDIRGEDVLAHIGPLTHSSGTYFAPWFLRGATSIVVEGGTVENLLAAIECHRVTVFTCVPTVKGAPLCKLMIDPKVQPPATVESQRLWGLIGSS